MNILGISAFYHDSAACLVRDGEIVAAAQEERFTRVKHDAAFPRHAVDYCLDESKKSGAAVIDAVAFYEKPFLKCDRLFASYLSSAPHGLSSFLKAVPVWIKEKLWIKQTLRDELNFDGPVLFPEHHESHAASAFFPSPFREAAILTIDGVGEWATTTIGHGKDNSFELLQETRFPHSIGLLYSAATYYLGFRVNSGEYKVMGLAPYGVPRFSDVILSELLDLKADGSFRLNMRHFDFVAGLTMIRPSFEQLFGLPRRAPEAELTQHHMDVARSFQLVAEEAMLRMARHARALTGSRYLCLAGGVALNCVGNGRILREAGFDDIWIQPAAGDAGGALGAALLAWHHYKKQPRTVVGGKDSQRGSFLGPEYHPMDFLRERGVPSKPLSEEELLATVATHVADGKVVGWYQARMEFGPRALGGRSIIGDPRRAEMQEVLNRKIKFRESFRPFAPAVMIERVTDYFELDRPSPYMLLTAAVRSSRGEPESTASNDFARRLRTGSSDIPAVTHVDGSARVQTVDAAYNPRFHRLLEAFEKQTGCPILINTSFNVRGEPPVCTPEDAYRCFLKTDMDYLALGDHLLSKHEQPTLPPDNVSKPNWFQQEYGKIDRSTRALRRFGFTMAGMLALLGVFGNRSLFWGIAAALVVLAQVAPTSLRPLYLFWMMLSLAMGWCMTRVILTITFFVAITPIGVLQRLCGKRPFEIALAKDAPTYWESRAPRAGEADYEKQY